MSTETVPSIRDRNIAELARAADTLAADVVRRKAEYRKAIETGKTGLGVTLGAAEYALRRAIEEQAWVLKRLAIAEGL